MRHGSLFSGIGGFDIAAEWMGWENVFHCEWNEFGKRVLNYYWPDADSHHDITKTDFTKYHGSVDLISGGFPCQPYSQAGKRLGKDDERHLWPHMLRAIREVSPRWVVGENVRGLTNWNGGVVFDEVQADLEAAGYEVIPFLLPAAGVGAPHRRDRIWFVAHNNDRDRTENRLQARREKHVDGSERAEITADATGRRGFQRTRWSETQQPEQPTEKLYTPDAESIGIQGNGTDWKQEPPAHAGQGLFVRRGSGTGWQEWPTQSPICGGDDGLPSELDGITFPRWRAESIKAYGNAVVPQVVLQIFKAIEQYDNLSQQI